MPVTRKFPDTSPPPATTRAAAAKENTPPASSDQPASVAPAPCRLNRRKVKAVATSGPASGIETDSAFAAYVVASIRPTLTAMPPAASSRRSMIAKAAIEADSSAAAASTQAQRG